LSKVDIREAEVAYEKAKIDAAIPQELQELRKYQEQQLVLTKAEKELGKVVDSSRTLAENLATDLRILDLNIAELEKKIAYRRLSLDAMSLEAATSGIAVYEDHPREGRKLQIGEMVQTSWAVMRIPNLAAMDVEAYVHESDRALLQAGQRARLTPDAYPQRQLDGSLISVAGYGKVLRRFGKTPYFKVIVKPDRIDTEIMKPGMSIRTEILVREAKDVLLIPIHLVDRQDSQFSIKPVEGPVMGFDALGFNEFFVAAPLDGPPREGMVLEAPASWSP